MYIIIITDIETIASYNNILYYYILKSTLDNIRTFKFDNRSIFTLKFKITE